MFARKLGVNFFYKDGILEMSLSWPKHKHWNLQEYAALLFLLGYNEADPKNGVLNCVIGAVNKYAAKKKDYPTAKLIIEKIQEYYAARRQENLIYQNPQPPIEKTPQPWIKPSQVHRHHFVLNNMNNQEQ